MSELAFFRSDTPLTLAAIAAECGIALPVGADPSLVIRATAMPDMARSDEVSILGAGLSADDAAAMRAGACLIAPEHRGLVPRNTVELVVSDPGGAFNRLAALLHPDSLRPGPLCQASGVDRAAVIHTDARLEAGVTIDPGVVVGPRAEIGSGTSIGANSVIGPGVRIGRDCAIDAHVSVTHALIGDRVILHAGVRIGHGGPNLRAGPRSPCLGRVIIQNDVEIGVNVSIARGRAGDTVVGEGSRIDPVAAIGCDTLIGRHVIVGPDGRL